jgi:PAS domain S-box-containing protein
MNPRYRILVVDDSDENRGAVAEMLEADGFAVDKACNGKEALLKLAVTAPDLFLLDVVMPEMGGLELLREIRVNDSEYEAVMMTGHESLDDAKKAMELGAFSYVAKPLRWAELKDHVYRALSMVKIKKERLRHLAALEAEMRKRSDELRMTAEILKSQSDRLDTVVNSMEEGLLAIDDQERIVLMNAQAEKILGARFGECAGETLAVAIAGPGVAAQLAALIDPAHAAAAERDIMTVPVDGGGTRFYHVNTQDIAGGNGARAGRVITFSDRTDRIKADQLRTSFLSVVAHELRTPVTVIMNYLAVLKDVHNMEAVDDMKTACVRLKRLIASLISLAALSDASIAVNRRGTNIVELVASHVEKLAAAAAEKGETILIENSLRSPVIATDPRLLGIALSGMLDNAVKFNKAGGKVRVGLNEISRDGAPFLSVSIADQGAGISERAKSHLFESFAQGEDHMTRQHRGLGAGLFLAQRAVELLDGRIDVESVGGQGSCFTCVMPMRSELKARSGATYDDHPLFAEVV